MVRAYNLPSTVESRVLIGITRRFEVCSTIHTL